HQSNVCLRGACLLILPSVAQQVSVQFFPAAIEAFRPVLGAQFFYSPVSAHGWDPASKNPGSFKRRSSRGRGRGGASRAAKKAFHCTSFKLKILRSASASSARANALSSTNSLTEQREVAAAALSVRLAWRVSRRSSFSLRVVLDRMAPPDDIQIIAFARQCQDDSKRRGDLCV